MESIVHTRPPSVWEPNELRIIYLTAGNKRPVIFVSPVKAAKTSPSNEGRRTLKFLSRPPASTCENHVADSFSIRM